MSEGIKLPSASITQDGLVTTVNQSFLGIKSFTSNPAFHADETTALTAQASSSTTSFRTTGYTEAYDIGSNFASGVFTCPVAGIYIFTVAAVVSAGGYINTAHLVIKKNSTEYRLQGCVYNNTITVYQNLVGSIVFQLAVSDTVQTGANCVTHSGTWSTDSGVGNGGFFSGCKIA